MDNSNSNAPPGAVYRMKQLRHLVGLAPATIYRAEQAGHFPRRIKLLGRAVGWRAADVEAWLSSRKIAL